MKRSQAFRFKLNPTGKQQRQMRRFAGSCRFAFNTALALQQQRYELGGNMLGYAALCRLLTEWRHANDTAWLASEVSGAAMPPAAGTHRGDSGVAQCRA